ncbi:MAG: transcription-repair coupling factor [Fibromonadaceae bacterium]|jgi:transcription-repair coupling factor (superfamily II helicase)|nr:transcription-repair coupling factor [Fibromonadaceae bacterium]
MLKFRTLAQFLTEESIPALDSLQFPQNGVAHSGNFGIPMQSVWAAMQFLKKSKPILIIAKNQKNLDLWFENLAEQVDEFDLLSLPIAKDESKSRVFSGILEERLRFIQSAKSVKIVVANAEALQTKLPSAKMLKEKTLDLKTGESLNEDNLREIFISRGFREQPIVESVGDFSIRGCIVDINPLLCERPIRMEFWGDTLETIRTFDIFTQRSLESLDSIEIFPMNLNEESNNSVFDFLTGYSIITDDYYNLPQPIFEELEKHPVINFSPNSQLSTTSLRLFTSEMQSREGVLNSQLIIPQTRSNSGFSGIEKDITEYSEKGGNVYLVAPTQGQALRLHRLSEESAVKEVLVGHLSEGFWFSDNSFALLSDHQIFNRFRHLTRKKQKASNLHGAVFADSLLNGDFVVHEDCGIGKFLGLSRIEALGSLVDCVVIEYANKARLTFPVGDLHKLEKLVRNEEDAPPALNRLGTKHWEQAKEKAKKRIAQVAKALIDLYAKREFIEGFAFPPDSSLQDEFENDFPFPPTPDQVRSAKEIKEDMEKQKPMDRLLCGDVGFGKTEVAMRAMFKCISAKKQVAVLVPTTVLAAQHFQSFTERFADWPVNIALVNRYKTSFEKKEIYRGLAEGKIDLVVGTHALLMDSIQFKDIGLLIIDEEQKFGVKQKERLREMRLSLDTLSMSATPIPRTLQLSMTGVRDISFLNTPPLNRLPVETKIMERDDSILAAAVKDEIDRGGQAFIVNDRVQGIEKLVDTVESWVPNLRVGIAHAQLPDSDLEKTMSAFINKEFDVLVCTVLIESGLDVPNTNTIIIMNAQQFGVGQLYQLRGRVGRSTVQARAYLVTPEGNAGVSKSAHKRLAAMERFTDLGSGYQVAMRDLEIRGAGNLLGMEQHGFIEEIGFETYVRMIKEAVEELRGTKDDSPVKPRLELRVDAYLPEQWIKDGLARISIYQRIARVETSEEIAALAEEMRDRFGPVPKPAEMLLACADIGVMARNFSIAGIARKQGVAVLTFADKINAQSSVLADLCGKSKLPLRFLANMPIQAVVEIGRSTAEEEVEALLGFFNP